MTSVEQPADVVLVHRLASGRVVVRLSRKGAVYAAADRHVRKGRVAVPLQTKRTVKAGRYMLTLMFLKGDTVDVLRVRVRV